MKVQGTVKLSERKHGARLVWGRRLEAGQRGDHGSSLAVK